MTGPHFGVAESQGVYGVISSNTGVTKVSEVECDECVEKIGETEEMQGFYDSLWTHQNLLIQSRTEQYSLDQVACLFCCV